MALDIAPVGAKIGIIGLGYVGLPLAIEFAREGYQVTGFDINSEKVDSLNSGKNYIPDIDSDIVESVVKEKMFQATTDYACLRELDAIFICVPTPFTENKDPQNYRSSIDSSVFYESVRPFIPALRKADLYRGHTGIIGLIKDQTDFNIIKDDAYPGCIHLLGMESPALTASLAIGRYVVDIIDK